MTTLQCGLLTRRHSSESSALEVHTLVGYTSAKSHYRKIISPQGCSRRQTPFEACGQTKYRCSQCGCRQALGAKRVVPRSAEPRFRACKHAPVRPGRKLQSAGAPRTPQALGQHSCTLSVGGRPRARRRAAKNRAAPDARRRGTADATSRITQPSTTQPPTWTTPS